MKKPKYNIGDKVWVASVSTQETTIPCPDCLGEKVWYVTTPSGETFDSPCGTCRYGWEHAGTIKRIEYKPCVHAGLIDGIERKHGEQDTYQYHIDKEGYRDEKDVCVNPKDAEQAARDMQANRIRVARERERAFRAQAHKDLRRPYKSIDRDVFRKACKKFKAYELYTYITGDNIRTRKKKEDA